MKTNSSALTRILPHPALAALRYDPVRWLMARDEADHIAARLGAAKRQMIVLVCLGAFGPVVSAAILSHNAFLLHWMTSTHIIVGFVGFLAMVLGLFAPFWAAARVLRQAFVVRELLSYRDEFSSFLAKYHRAL